MATKQSTVDFITEQAGRAGHVTAKKMFGEYALYCDTKLIGLICDEQLFIKPTAAGRTHIGTVTELPPYPGAKPYFQVPGERWDDADWLTELIKQTAAALPTPAAKNPIKKKRSLSSKP